MTRSAEPAAGGTASVSDCTRGGRSGLSWICAWTVPRSPVSHQRQWAGVSNSGWRPGSSPNSPMRSRIRAILRRRSSNGASIATFGENSRCAAASSQDLSSWLTSSRAASVSGHGPGEAMATLFPWAAGPSCRTTASSSRAASGAIAA